jgi:hypothetical protein
MKIRANQNSEFLHLTREDVKNPLVFDTTLVCLTVQIKVFLKDLNQQHDLC